MDADTLRTKQRIAVKPQLLSWIGFHPAEMVTWAPGAVESKLPQAGGTQVVRGRRSGKPDRSAPGDFARR